MNSILGIANEIDFKILFENEQFINVRKIIVMSPKAMVKRSKSFNIEKNTKDRVLSRTKSFDNDFNFMNSYIIEECSKDLTHLVLNEFFSIEDLYDVIKEYKIKNCEKINQNIGINDLVF